ncbi:GLUG motif-containing protein, partial [Caldanaerobius fijiensis]
VTGNNYTGGLVGWNNGSTITNSYSTGKVTGSSYTGGLVGG